VAYWLLTNIAAIGSTLILIIVALFLAAGLNPAVTFFERHGLRRAYAVLVVIICVIIAVVLFLVAIVPVITDQVRSITDQAPSWFDRLLANKTVQDVDDEYDVIDKAQDYVTGGDFVGTLFGGALGIGLAVLGALFNAFIILVLTLYFLSSLDTTKNALYRLAPASRRDRVSRLGNRIIESVGGYVSGAFIVATCAGLSSVVFLFAVGLGEYAVALAFVVAVLDVIPMIGATIGAVVVTLIAFAEDPKIGVACVIFYVIYQQVENYVIYPRVMSKSVDVPGAVTVIAALVGAALLGVVGALLAIPTAAAILMLTREVFVRRQDKR
jgi:predicted PurR-regulated permease PerM